MSNVWFVIAFAAAMFSLGLNLGAHEPSDLLRQCFRREDAWVERYEMERASRLRCEAEVKP